MLSKIWVINIFLTLLVAFLGMMTYEVWFEQDGVVKTDKTLKLPPKTHKTPNKIFDEKRVLPESDYGVVVNMNLFSSKRTEERLEKKTPAEEKQTFTVGQVKELNQQLAKMILYGLIITDDSARALVTDVAFKNIYKRGRTTRQLNVVKLKWVETGDSLGGFKVAKIKNDRVLLTADKKTYELLLYDKKKSKSRRPAKPKSGPTVVGVSVKPQVPAANERIAIVPPTSKKGTAAKTPFGTTPPPTRKNLIKAVEKKQIR